MGKKQIKFWGITITMLVVGILMIVGGLTITSLEKEFTKLMFWEGVMVAVAGLGFICIHFIKCRSQKP